MKATAIGILVLIAAATVLGQQGLPVRVTETAGIRRNAYPASARVELPAGGASDVSHVRLRLNGTDVPAQFEVASKWPDGTLRALDADFNASIGPRETLAYTVEFGADVTAPPAAPRGLAVTETSDAIQVGSVSLGKTGSPLLRSVKYRDEDIGDGPNGFAIVDAAGQSHDITFTSDAVRVVKRGPLNVVIRYEGETAIDAAHRLKTMLTIEMPNSKTWVKMAASVQDPDQQVRAIVFRNTLSLGAFPLLWDFGTPKGTYGVFRAAADSATFTRAPASATRLYDWTVGAAAGGRPPQTIEADSDSVAASWAHVQGSKEAVAFAADFPASGSGTYTLRVAGDAALTAQFVPQHPAREPSLTVYEHFVAAPVQIGAATTAAAMLAPLVVR